MNNRENTITILGILLANGVFLIDLFQPQRIGIGLLFIPILILVSTVKQKNMLFHFAVFASIFLAAGFVIPILLGEPQIDGIGRLLEIGLVNVCAAMLTWTSRQTEDKQSSQVHLQNFLDNNPAAAWLKDEEGRYVYANKAAAEKFSRSSKPLKGLTDFDWTDGDKARDIRRRDHDAMSSQAAQEGVERLTYEDGEERVWYSLRFPYQDENGRELLGGLAFDITAYDKGKAALRQLASIVGSSQDAIFIKDINGIVLTWNAGAERIYGYLTQEMVGQSIERVFPDNRKNEFQEIMAAIRSGKRIVQKESIRRRKDGKYIYVSLTAMPLRDDRGKIYAASVICREITDRKLIENNLRELKEHLELEKNKLELVLSLEENLNAILNIDQLADFVVQNSARILESSRCSLMLLDEETNELCIRGHVGVDEDCVRTARVKVGEAVSGWVAESGQSVLVRNIELDYRFQRENRRTYRNKSFMSVPIKINHSILGVLNVSEKNAINEAGFTDLDLKILNMIARHVAISLESAKMYRELNYLTVTDPLTNIYNYRHFSKCLDAEIARSRRYGGNVCLMMLDIDKFRRYNDDFGSEAGDQLLIDLAKELSLVIRDTDTICRYAGDEFVVILPQTNVEQATIVAQKIKARASSLTGKGPISVSIGIAKYHESMDRHDLILKADMALYNSKQRGQDSIVAYQ